MMCAKKMHLNIEYFFLFDYLIYIFSAEKNIHICIYVFFQSTVFCQSEKHPDPGLITNICIFISRIEEAWIRNETAESQGLHSTQL